MKKRAGIFLLLLAICLVIFLIGSTMIRKAKAEDDIEKIRNLPSLVVKDMMDNVFCTDQITSGPLLITFFHPECDHCKYEISSFMENLLPDSSIKIVLVSYADQVAVMTFMEELEVSYPSNLKILIDPDLRMTDMFRAEIIPSNYIYNDSLQLVKIFKGATKPETLLKYLTGND
jgi:hypothetical protein